MAVEGAAGQNDGFRQAQALRPFGTERADRDIGGPGVAKQRPAQVPVDNRIELIEEAGRRQTAPAFVPQ